MMMEMMHQQKQQMPAGYSLAASPEPRDWELRLQCLHMAMTIAAQGLLKDKDILAEAARLYGFVSGAEVVPRANVVPVKMICR